jgi:hypothetical protein
MQQNGPYRRLVGVLDDEPTGRQSLDSPSEISFGLLSILAYTREPVENSRAIGIRL